MLRRARFADVIARQLDLFEREHPGDVAEAQLRLDAYNEADRDGAEELYGDYVDAVDVVKDQLEQIRDAYAATLDGQTRAAYEREFARALAKRFPRFAR
jgi:hypothetical protein